MTRIVLKRTVLYRTVSCKYRIEPNRSKAESLQPYSPDTLLWMLLLFNLPPNYGEAQDAKLNGSKVFCPLKMLNLMAANIYGFTIKPQITTKHDTHFW